MGWNEGDIEDERVQVQKTVVKPGWKTSLLKHRHYPERRVMVARTAKVQVSEN